ncbi:M15 family metallopeptidase [Nocardioides halotolerans]|uniref:M15 family metallopeptidase n=1 Tax=Nocardioides halotolerans TaxID=433660 RepID=UPI00041426C0|nr:M15 family metallopeptidase [Nocardioides halotolerans]
MAGVGRALATTVAVVTLAASSGCTGEGRSAEPAPSSVGSGTTVAPTIEDNHAVPAPGPRQPGVVAPADILVVGGETLDPATVAAIQELDGVTDVAVISLSESVIENRALRVAAVDPATYRTFVRQRSADFQEAWDRLAGGELALKKRLKDRVPTDAQGYLQLGAAADAPKVHIGTFIDQQPLIDAVVNETWIDTLDMVRDNALLVRTGQHAPKPIRHKIEKLLAAGTSAQLVDLATRTGIDPSAQQLAVVTGSVADAVGVYRYSVLGAGHIAPDPAWVRAHITTETVPLLGAVTCNKVVFRQLRAALEEVHERGLDDAIHPDQFAGCYYPRFIAGTTTLSNHAFGLALDINAVENQRGTAGLIDRGVVQIFQKWGFTWGGDWRYTDPMHFELNSVVTPTPESARN